MVYDMKYIWRKGVAWYWGVNLYPMESVLKLICIHGTYSPTCFRISSQNITYLNKMNSLLMVPRLCTSSQQVKSRT